MGEDRLKMGVDDSAMPGFSSEFQRDDWSSNRSSTHDTRSHSEQTHPHTATTTTRGAGHGIDSDNIVYSDEIAPGESVYEPSATHFGKRSYITTREHGRSIVSSVQPSHVRDTVHYPVLHSEKMKREKKEQQK